MCKITIFYSNGMPEKSFRLGKKGTILSHQQHFLGPIGPLPRKKIETLILIKMSQIFLTHSIQPVLRYLSQSLYPTDRKKIV